MFDRYFLTFNSCSIVNSWYELVSLTKYTPTVNSFIIIIILNNNNSNNFFETSHRLKLQ